MTVTPLQLRHRPEDRGLTSVLEDYQRKINELIASSDAISTTLLPGSYEPLLVAGVSTQYYRGDKTWATLTQNAIIGLTTSDGPTFNHIHVNATAYSLLVATATNTVGELAAVGTQYQVLRGNSGALPTWQTKAPIDIRDWGVPGGGSVDDAIQINAAIASLGADGGTIFFPVGTCTTDTAIAINTDRVTLLGTGFKSIIQGRAASTHTLVTLGATANTQFTTLRNLAILGTVTNAGGLLLGSASFYTAWILLDGVQIYGFSKTGVYGLGIATAQELDIKDCWISNNYYNVHRLPGGYMTSTRISGMSGYIGLATRYGVYIEGNGGDLRVRDIVLESNHFGGIHSIGEQVCLTLDGAYFETNCFGSATGVTDGSTAVITGLDSTVGFQVGGQVTASAGFNPLLASLTVVSKTDYTLTVDSLSISAQTGVVVKNYNNGQNSPEIFVTSSGVDHKDATLRMFNNTISGLGYGKYVSMGYVTNCIIQGNLGLLQYGVTDTANSKFVHYIDNADDSHADVPGFYEALLGSIQVEDWDRATGLRYMYPNSGAPVAAHQLDSSAFHTVSSLTPGHFLKATGAGSFGFAAHGLTYSDVGADVAGAAAARQEQLSGTGFVKAAGTTISYDNSAYLTSVTAHDQNASTIIIPTGMGTPTYDDAQDFLNMTQASGRLTGGVLTAHAGPDGTLDISEMEGMIHTANTLGSPLIYFKKAAVASIALTDLAVNYIWIHYTEPGGVPTLTYSANAARPTDDYDVFVVGRCFRSGNSVEVITTGQNIYNEYGRAQDRLLTKYGSMDNASGAIVSAHATPLRLSATAGVWYFGNTRTDTSAKDTFRVWYKTGGSATWVKSATVTLFSDIFDGAAAKAYEVYQDGSSLGTLSGSKYGVYWLFICPDTSDPIYVVLGTADYANIAAAQAATVPTSLPPYCVNWARLVGRVICQKTGAAFHSVESVFSTKFTLSAAVDHAGLVNLDYAGAGHTGFEPAITAGTTAQYLRGDKSLGTLNQAAVVGLTTADGPTFDHLHLTSGQITFPAAQSASADANTLDDYEEGTKEVAFAAGTSGTITIHASYKTVTYTKIGRQVTVCGQLRVDSVAAPIGTFGITGLPFTSGCISGVGLFSYGWEANCGVPVGYIAASSTTILVYGFSEVSGTVANFAAFAKAGAEIFLQFTYFV